MLPVGGIKEKCLGAIKNNITKIFVPACNKDEIIDIPKTIKNKLKFIYVDDYKDIYNYLMKDLKDSE